MEGGFFFFFFFFFTLLPESGRAVQQQEKKNIRAPDVENFAFLLACSVQELRPRISNGVVVHLSGQRFFWPLPHLQHHQLGTVRGALKPN